MSALPEKECTRRGFFREGARELAGAVAAGLETVAKQVAPATPEAPPKPQYLRPPGALDEAAFLERCTACGDCVPACPKQAIKLAGTEFGEGLAKTPVILPETSPCWLCEGFPCIAACPEGALLPVESASEVRMGTARVAEASCFSAKGSICETCAERCIVRPKAIRVGFAQAPRLDAELCTGCGVCVWLCPADAVTVART